MTTAPFQPFLTLIRRDTFGEEGKERPLDRRDQE
jgi:hypothetical protein